MPEEEVVLPQEQPIPEPQPVPVFEDPKYSPMYYYNCGHGSSNSPCPVHFPNHPVMPDNWYKTYQVQSPPQEPPGLSDQADLGTEP